MKDFSFQGRIWLGTRLANGKPGPLQEVGDAPKLQLKFTADTSDRTESRSGNRVQSARLQKGKKAELSMTLNYFGAMQLALGLYGKVNTVAPGTITGEVFPDDLAVGDVVALDQPNMSDLVVTDSAGTPKTLVEGTDYQLVSARASLVRILGLGTPAYTQPFEGAYSNGGSIDVSVFTDVIPERYLLLDGINTVDGEDYGKPVIARVWRCNFNPISQLDLISDDFGQLELDGAVLYDDINAADSNMGGFGKFSLPSDV